jgi:hypothetical protein
MRISLLLDEDEAKCLQRLLSGESLVPAEWRELIRVTELVDDFIENDEWE